ncbi:hypothetical protein ACFL2V_01595 [Pseudomonadota bacterium]
MGPALRVVSEKAPLSVTRAQSNRYAHGVGPRLFGITKLRSSRLASWRLLLVIGDFSGTTGR